MWIKYPRLYVHDLFTEIDKTSSQLMRRNLSIDKSIDWSFKDILDIFSTKGKYLIQERSSWSKVKYNTSKPPSQFWTSLNKVDEICIRNFSERKECEQTSKKIQILTSHFQSPLFNPIFNKLFQPGKFEDPYVKGNAKTRSVPFCWTGKELEKMKKRWNRLLNYNFPEGRRFYGYKFCENVQQVVSDLGLCATFNPGPLLMGEKSVEDENPLYPVRKSKDFFENGILLVIDTSSFGLMKNQVLDTFRQSNNDDEDEDEEAFSSNLMNDIKVLIHSRSDVPMFYDQEARPIRLDYDEPTSIFDEKFQSIQAHRIFITAEVYESSANVEKKKVSARGCRLKDEIDGLRWFKQYSEKNCLFQCKMRILNEKCGCFPLWMKTILDRNDKFSFKICDMQVIF